MASRVALAPAARRDLRVAAAARPMHLFCIAVVCLAVYTWSTAASALVVGPGDSVEVTFAFPSPPDVGGGAIDFLALTTTPFSASEPDIAVSAQLFDRGALLGSGVRPSAALISFSGGLFANAIVASLSSVTDADFQGRILFTPIFAADAGFLDFDPVNFNVRAGHGSAGGVLLAQDGAVLRSVGIPTVETPTPAALLLFVSALAVLGIALYWRRSRDRAGPDD